jgi:addiction module HigA family antidote
MARPVIHPGEVLKDELEFLEMSAAELARALDVPANRVSQLLAGKRAITADTAVRLGYWLGTGPELWLNLQRQYELHLIEETDGPAIRSRVTHRRLIRRRSEASWRSGRTVELQKVGERTSSLPDDAFTRLAPFPCPWNER